MKLSEITKSANDIIKTIFKEVKKSDDKEVWKKAFEFIKQKEYEGSNRFVWERVKIILSKRYGEKFIKNIK